VQARMIPPACLTLAVLIIVGCAGSPRPKIAVNLPEKYNTPDGVGGLLDRPSEVCLRGNKIYVSNIDLPMKGNEYDRPHTISLIKLK